MSKTQNIFTQRTDRLAPLADRLRPKSFDEFVGQEELIGEHSILRKAIARNEIPSMIFWGPPGSGKTTLAYLIADACQAECIRLSAVSSGKGELQKILADAEKRLELHEQKTILFIDEIHRWNKAQQDALLPAVEKGRVILIGATTENPSFEVNSALLSRCQVFVLKPLSDTEMKVIIDRTLRAVEREAEEGVQELLIALAQGDARAAINTIELAAASGKHLGREAIKKAVQKTFLYDKHAEQHYNLISALHKCMRASDADAALYWLARMLIAGEDPLYIARRIIRFASEDVGNERPNGLVLAIAAYEACHFIGMPECNLALTQAVEYLAKAPKSRCLYDAWEKIMKDIEEHPNEGVPMHLRNAPTPLMKQLGYGKKEQESNLPLNLADRKYL